MDEFLCKLSRELYAYSIGIARMVHSSDGTLNSLLQLLAFLQFIHSIRALESLRSKNWAEFSKKYNGPGYAYNRYDAKLAREYANYI